MTRDPQHEIDEELKFHLDQRIRDYIAQGMSPQVAREAAIERFGSVARVRKVCTSLLRADRAAEDRRIFVNVSWLDLKLGIRMLAKYPGLSAVAVTGLALAIAIGATYFGILGAVLVLRCRWTMAIARWRSRPNGRRPGRRREGRPVPA